VSRMLLTVRHITRYRYDAPVRRTVQSLRLMPRDHVGQRVLDWQVSVNGKVAGDPFFDGYGNAVQTLVIDGAHDELVVEAAGSAETADTSGVLQGTDERMPAGVLLRVTPLTVPSDAIGKLAEECGVAGGELEGLHALMALLPERIAFRTETTDAQTTAAEALQLGTGVCQDFAHVFIAAARCRGVPARYVTGYMCDSEADGPSEAKHAWAEALVEGLGWVGFDAANGRCPTDAYVRVACGLDAEDTAPIRGTRQGGGAEEMTVAVTVGEGQSQQ